MVCVYDCETCLHEELNPISCAISRMVTECNSKECVSHCYKIEYSIKIIAFWYKAYNERIQSTRMHFSDFFKIKLGRYFEELSVFIGIFQLSLVFQGKWYSFWALAYLCLKSN